MKTKTVLFSLILLLLALACGRAEQATPTKAVEVATATAVPTWTPQPTHTPYPTYTPYPSQTPQPTRTPYPTYTPYPSQTPPPTDTPQPMPTAETTATPRPSPTLTPEPTATFTSTATRTPSPTKTPNPTAIPLVSYENDQLAVVFKYPSDCEQPDFSFDQSAGIGEVDIDCGLDGYFGVYWSPSPTYYYETLEEEAEPRLLDNETLVRHEPVIIGGQPGYLTETKWGVIPWLEIITRYQGYSYEFTWFNASHEKMMMLFDSTFPHIRFLPTTAIATPQPPAPTSVPPTAGWREIARWEGSGIKTTEPFDVPGDFRVSWSASGTVRDGYDLFQIMVYENGDLHSIAANYMGLDTTDVSYIYTGGGSFHLVINSTMNWVVVVEAR